MKLKSAKCPDCHGHGMVTNSWTGEPDDCRTCDNSGRVIVAERDRKGRFVRESDEPEVLSSDTGEHFIGG